MQSPLKKVEMSSLLGPEDWPGVPISARSRLDSLILVGLLGLVVFTALAFGTVEAWSIFTFEILVIILFFIWGLRAFYQKRIELKIPPFLLPVIFFLLIGGIQSYAYMNAAGEVHSLSKDVEATRWATTIILFLAVCAFLTVNVFNNREWVRRVAIFLVIYGLAMAVFALIQYLSWDNRFYWLRPTDQGSAFGPFVNRNHYAGYMEMLIPMPAALIFSRNERSELRFFYSFAVILMSVSLVMSASRGGMVSLAAGLMFVVLVSMQKLQETRTLSGQGNLISRNGMSSKKAYLLFVPLGLAFVLILLGGLLWLGPEPVLNRITDSVQSLSQENNASQYLNRDWIWRDSLKIFRAHPLVGTGLGSFETVYPQFGHSDGTTVIPQAHNDYLQVLTDAGIFGGLCLLAFLGFLTQAIVKSLSVKDPKMRGIAIGISGGIVAMLVHSFFDFNLQIPANALLFLFLVSVVSCIGIYTPLRKADAPSSTAKTI